MRRYIALTVVGAALVVVTTRVAAQQGRKISPPPPVTAQRQPVAAIQMPGSSDITFAGGVSFGVPIVKQANWGPTVTLSAAQAHGTTGGKCYFYLTYQMHNLGSAPTSAVFSNTIQTNAGTISSGMGLSLDAGATQQKQVLVPLQSGANHLLFKLDSYDAVKEANENNNSRALGVTVEGSCAEPAAQARAQPASSGAGQAPNLTGAGKSVLTSILADIGVSGVVSLGSGSGHSTAWGGTITISGLDAQSTSNGYCVFPLIYAVRNTGAAATAMGFKNRIWRNDGSQGAILSEHTVATLAAGETRQIYTLVHLVPGASELHFVLDLGHQVNESDENDNLQQVQVQVTGTCDGSAWQQGQEVRSGKSTPGQHEFEVPSQASPGDHAVAANPTESISPPDDSGGPVSALPGPSPTARALGGPDTKLEDNAIIIHARQCLGQRLGRAGIDIRVRFQNGVFTLSGQVKTLAEKQAAEQAVQGTPGVRLIQNQLVVAP